MSDERPEQMSDYIASITKNLAPAEISEWLKRVTELAQRRCPDSVIQYKAEGDFGDITASSRKSLQCVLDALKVYEDEAPDLIKAILASYRIRLEQQL